MPMRENLLGYLLGALDGSEHEEVKRELERDPQLQRDLRILEANLVPLECDRWQHDPPPGLARRTTEFVVRHCRRASSSIFATGRVFSPTAAATVGCERSPGCSLADMFVAAGVFFAAALLFFPAIANSRYQARLVACQENLRQLGADLGKYSDLNHGYFPYVPARGKLAAAGTFAPILLDAGLLERSEILICPASELAERREHFRVPTLAEWQQATGRELILIRRGAGGSYGYTLGYMDDGRYCAIRNEGRGWFAIMADTPRVGFSQRVTDNHGGCGINVLFEDLHVGYFVQCKINASGGDDVFRNDFGRVEAGVHCDDAVIGHSGAAPLPIHYIQQH